MQTLWCANVLHDQLVQVTNREVRLVAAGTQQVSTIWQPPEGKNIIVASGNATQVCVATSAGNVVFFKIDEGAITEVAHAAIDGEISCLNLNPIGKASLDFRSSDSLRRVRYLIKRRQNPKFYTGENADEASLLVVGTWSMKVHLFSLPSLQIVNSHELGGEVMPRSILLALLEEKPYLLCGLGDGTLLSYRIEEGLELTERKKLALGTKPIALREFKYVFLFI